MTRDEGYISIATKDCGEEIPEEFIQLIFSRFARANPTAKTQLGTGLGLSITKLLIERKGSEKYAYTAHVN